MYLAKRIDPGFTNKIVHHTILNNSVIKCFSILKLFYYFHIFHWKLKYLCFHVFQVTMTPEPTQHRHTTIPFRGIPTRFQKRRKRNDQNLDPDRKSMFGTRINIFEC